MKKIFIRTLWRGVMAGLLTLAGCANILEPAGAPSVSGDSGEVAIHIGDAARSRTAAPDAIVFAKYELSFSGGSLTHAPVEVTSGSATVELAVGVWTIGVTAYTGSDPTYLAVAEGKAENVSIQAGTNAPVVIVLGPKAGAGNGTFTYDLTVQADAAGALEIRPAGSGSVVETIALTPGRNAGSRTLSSGQYLARARLEKDGKVAGLAEALHIYAGLESALPARVYAEADFVAPVPLLVGAKAWYVSGPYGDDLNDGLSAATPLGTVAKALELIKTAYAAAWPGKGIAPERAYILVEGEVQDAGSGENTYDLSSAGVGVEYPPIEIRGKDAADPGILRAAAGKRVLYVKNNKLILGPNLTLTGAHAARNGAGVYGTEGSEITLAGADITGNTGTGDSVKGAGVYLDAAAKLSIEGGSVNGNTLSSSSDARGAGIYVTGYLTSAVMSGGVISGNRIAQAGTYGAGGAVCLETQAKFTMTGGTIVDNSAPDSPASSGTPYGGFGGGGVFVGYQATFALGGAARINENNPVRLESDAAITLASAFDGAGPVATVDLALNPNGLANNVWAYKAVLVKASGYSGSYQTDRFALGNFKWDSANPSSGVNMSILNGINPGDHDDYVLGTDGILKPKTFVVGSIAVTPASIKLIAGTTYPFAAKVNPAPGSLLPPQTVTWSLTASDGSSSINPATGLLSLGAAETAPSLTVTATSTVAGAVSGTALVDRQTADTNVTWYVSDQGNDTTNDGKSESASLATVKKALELISTAYKGQPWPQDGGNDKAALIIVSGEIAHPTAMDSTNGTLALASATNYPPVELYGKSAESPGTIKANPGKRVMYIKSARVTLGANLFLTEGSTSSSRSGGGVCVDSGGTLILNGAVIKGNSASSSTKGGGVAVIGGGNFIFRSGEITENNTASGGGGGVSVESASAGTPSTFTMEGGAISANTTATAGGGGVYLAPYSIFEMSGGEIAQNEALKSNGGGVYVSGGTFAMTGGVIQGNTAGNYGKGVYLARDSYNTSVFKVGDGALVNSNNDVTLQNGTSLTLLSGFTGAAFTFPPIQIYEGGSSFVNNFDYVYECIGGAILRWESGSSPLPLEITSKFALGKIWSGMSEYREMSPYLEIDSDGNLARVPAQTRITAMGITPAAPLVAIGSTQELNPAPATVGFPPREVSWSLSGNNDSGTTIAPSSVYNKGHIGVLTVAPSETASSVTVTVTSDFDSTKTASATVTITDGKLRGPGGAVYAWNEISTGFTGSGNIASDMVYGNGVFVAVGLSGRIAYSAKNNLHWTLSTTSLGTGINFARAGYGVYEGLDEQGHPITVPTFVVTGSTIGLSSQGKILYSTDNGVSWTAATVPADIASNYAYINGIVFHNNTFIANTSSSVSGKYLIASTNGGKTWSWIDNVSGFDRSPISYLYAAGGKIFALYRIGEVYVYSSPDGTTWSSYLIPGSSRTNTPTLAFGNNEILLLGSTYSWVPRASSLDADDPGDWTDLVPSNYPNAPTTTYVAGAYGDGLYCFVGDNPQRRLLFSNDGGATWLEASNNVFSSSLILKKLIFVDGDFYGIASNGTFVYTTH